MAGEVNRHDFMEWFTPVQKEQNRVQMYAITEKDDLSLLKKDIPHVSYFNQTRKSEQKCLYDLLFHPDLNYDQNLTKCDRHSQRTAEKNIYEEESNRVVPVLTSSLYGKRKTVLEDRSLARHNKSGVIKEFERRNNINLKSAAGLSKTFDKLLNDI